MKINVERNGKIIALHPKLAQVLIGKGIVKQAYLTRDMADQPKVIKNPDIGIPTSDDLDAMDKAKLHALAKERGLQLHHMLGADKVRAALRGEE